MTLISIGDMAQTFMLRRFSAGMKQDAKIAAKELTTGYSADIGKKLGGELSRLSGLEASLSRLKGYKVVSDTMSLSATTMQSVLGQIDKLTDGLGTSLMSASNMESSGLLDGLVTDSAERFKSVLASLNTKVGDSSLFAGVATDRPAVSSPEVILSALEAAITGAGAISAADIETAVTTWFDDPSGFATVGYLGGTASSAISISPEDQVDLGITALDPAIKDTLKSLSLVALVARGTVVPDPDTGKELVNRAGAALLQNQSDRTALSGRLGYMQARIDQAQTRNEAENSALQLARNNLLAVDPYEAATRMEAAQNQLETLYSVTARLSRLKLVDFLR